MNEPRANDPADHAPGGDRPPVLLADLPPKQTQREPDAEEDADRGEDPVPRKRDGAEMHIGIERNIDQRRECGRCAAGATASRVAPASGLCASRGSSRAKTADITRAERQGAAS